MDPLVEYSLNFSLRLAARIRNLTARDVTKKSWSSFRSSFSFCSLSFSTISLEVRYSLRTRVVSRPVVSSPVLSCLSRTRFLNDSNFGIFEQAEHISCENVPTSAALKEARNSFLGLGVYLLKSKFRIEDKLRFP